jgi:hypothetical protein
MTEVKVIEGMIGVMGLTPKHSRQKLTIEEKLPKKTIH